jgi:hypothetical protein
MGFIVTILIVLAAGAYALVSRLLAHKERMAEIEARRPKVVLQLPDAPLLEGDELSAKIIEACRQQGVELDVELEIGPR